MAMIALLHMMIRTYRRCSRLCYIIKENTSSFCFGKVNVGPFQDLIIKT